MTEEILGQFKNEVKEMTLIPSSNGVFEVTLNGALIFSKKELNRFPDQGEVITIIKNKGTEVINS